MVKSKIVQEVYLKIFNTDYILQCVEDEEQKNVEIKKTKWRTGVTMRISGRVFVSFV